MKVAISIWQDRISPVFDSSQWLQVVDVDGKEATSRREHIGDRPPFAKVELLQDLSIDVLICGAVTRQLHIDLVRSGIAVYPFVCGRADEVLDDFLRDRRIDSRFAMPGYGRRTRRRNRRC